MSLFPCLSTDKKQFYVFSPHELTAIITQATNKVVNAVECDSNSRAMMADLCGTFGKPFSLDGDVYRFEGGDLYWFGGVFGKNYSALFKPIAERGEDNLFYTWTTPSRTCIGRATKSLLDLSNVSLRNKRYIASPERSPIDADAALERIFGEEHPFVHHPRSSSVIAR